MGWCDEVEISYHPEVDHYNSISSCYVFYSSYTKAICCVTFAKQVLYIRNSCYYLQYSRFKQPFPYQPHFFRCLEVNNTITQLFMLLRNLTVQSPQS